MPLMPSGLKMRPRAGIFMPMMPIPFLFASGSTLGDERQVVRVGGVQRHQDRVEVEPLQPLHQDLRVEVAGDAEEAHHLLVAGLLERLDRAVLSEDLVELLVALDVVQLPQVQVIGLAAACRLCSSSRSDPSRVRSSVLLARKTSLRRVAITSPM